MNDYIKGKGVFIGEFYAIDIINGIDKKIVKEKQEELNLKYVNSELIKKKNKIVGIKLYLCNAEDIKI